MPRFFIDPVNGGTAVVTGADAHHISRVLRMRVGESLTLCDGTGTDYDCEIETVTAEAIQLRILNRQSSVAEPHTAVTIYQGLPKSEKMDLIVQKAVEIGATRIVPVAMARSIVRLKGDEGTKKKVRWQKIAAEAAGQSGRGRIPTVEVPITFAQAVAAMSKETAIAFYEGGGVPLDTLIGSDTKAVSFIVGPEGGFEPTEIQQLQAAGVRVATLGKRILRCETAPLVALSVIMQLTGNME